MTLKELLAVRDTVSCPILVFKTSVNEYTYIANFFPLDADFEAYDEYIHKHSNDEVHNIGLVSKGKLVGLSVCLKTL